MAEKRYSFDDLARALSDYQKVKSDYDNAMRMAEAKRIEMTSFEKTAAEAWQHVTRYERLMKEIIRDLGKD